MMADRWVTRTWTGHAKLVTDRQTPKAASHFNSLHAAKKIEHDAKKIAATRRKWQGSPSRVGTCRSVQEMANTPSVVKGDLVVILFCNMVKEQSHCKIN
jgi:hypothetical protein